MTILYFLKNSNQFLTMKTVSDYEGKYTFKGGFLFRETDIKSPNILRRVWAEHIVSSTRCTRI